MATARDTRRPYTRAGAGWRSGPRTAPPRAATGAGATGLEPATSGVTGRADRNDGGRRSTRIACKCGTSEPIRDVEARYVLTAPRRRLGHNRATAQQLGVAFLDAPACWEVGEVDQRLGEPRTRRRQHVFDAPLLRDGLGIQVVGASGPVALQVALPRGKVRSKVREDLTERGLRLFGEVQRAEASVAVVEAVAESWRPAAPRAPQLQTLTSWSPRQALRSGPAHPSACWCQTATRGRSSRRRRRRACAPPCSPPPPTLRRAVRLGPPSRRSARPA
jgi:hypothetical protein